MDYAKIDSRDTKLTFYGPNKEKDDGSPVFIKSLLTRELRHALGLRENDQLPFAVEVIGEGSVSEDGKYHVLKVTFGPEVLTATRQAAVKQALETTQQEFASRPQPDRLENFDSQLATETRFRALWAILASWAAIAVYLWFRFGNWTFGMAAVLCLVHDLFFTLGAIALCHYFYGTAIGNIFGLEDFKIDLTAVAALLTLVGYSVNDTIVVFDRIREVRGKNPDLTPKMINDSINQTLSRTILASLATWLVVFMLYVTGGQGVHLFAFVMVVGVIVGTYSSIYIASPLLLMFGEGTHETTRPVDTRFQSASV
jgi:SecD/SecF fusion protein